MPPSRFLDRNTPPHIVTLVLIAGIAALSQTIFLPALPEMAAYFATDYAVMQLALSGYLAGTAILQLFIGPLSDRYGRRPVMIGALVILILATVVCVLSTHIAVFLAARLMQTAVVAGMVLSRAIVRDMVPVEQAASMIGYVTMGMALVPMFGPAAGGLLSETFGWQASFAALAILAVAVLAVVVADLGETNRRPLASFRAQLAVWPELLASRQFWNYALISVFVSGSFFSFLGGAPFVGTTLLELSPGMLGLQFLYTAGGYMTGNFLSGRYARRLGLMRMLLIGNGISLLGIGLALVFALSGHFTALSFFGSMVLMGLGNGVALPSANAGMVNVRPDLAGSASGLGGALTLGLGAALSVIAPSIMSEETGPVPFIAIMLVCALAAMVSIAMLRSDRD
ncbi:multidrug effflux MFS transporter [Rhizobiaceae bacterium BDR2-2]|uniref:Bcr/CflA family efflux transporter n=1 Tax=Ectorhizobium quercum TaxID=2965071 RepID=A0AAE3N5V1_9HYPH|nr:multidrug effflux MFS transporter [Ectorhizobium quercum]MCX8999825.1 multidrug effflux MFS transporter [Ectorhizobium quercum]